MGRREDLWTHCTANIQNISMKFATTAAKSCKKKANWSCVCHFYVHKWLKKQIARYESRDCCNNLYSDNLLLQRYLISFRYNQNSMTFQTQHLEWFLNTVYLDFLAASTAKGALGNTGLTIVQVISILCPKFKISQCTVAGRGILKSVLWSIN